MNDGWLLFQFCLPNLWHLSVLLSTLSWSNPRFLTRTFHSGCPLFFWVVSLYLLQLLENFPATWLSSLVVWFLLPVETFFFFIWFSLFDLVESCLLFGVFDDECNSAVVGVSSVFLRRGWWHFYTFLYIVVFVLLKCFLMFCIDWIKWVEAWRLSYTGYTSIIYKVCKVSLTFSTKEHEGALFWIPVL